jgi:hypothetical protein
MRVQVCGHVWAGARAPLGVEMGILNILSNDLQSAEPFSFTP